MASKITKLGVIGAGQMGAGIALVAAKSKLNVVLMDSNAKQLQKGMVYSFNSGTNVCFVGKRRFKGSNN